MILRSRLVAAAAVVLSFVACGPEMRKVPNLSGAWLGQMTVTSSQKTAVLVADGGVSIDDGNANREWPVTQMPKVSTVTLGECVLYEQARASESVVALSGECAAQEIANTFCSTGNNRMLSLTGTLSVASSSVALSATGSIRCGADFSTEVPVEVTGSYRP